jgi:hypothetical protein
LQTVYAELVERCSMAELDQEFPASGSFVKTTIKGRHYWYFRMPADARGVRKKRYVGPDSPELAERIARHGTRKNDERERKALVAALRRGLNLPGPVAEVAEILRALAEGGVFRLRACLIGTTAFQTYSPLLGVRLKASLAQTSDLDLAQFHSTSVAIAEDDATEPLLDLLKKVDKTFKPVPYALDGRRHIGYVNARRFRVDVLVPNPGKQRDAPSQLPALGAEGVPLRLLDFLIYDSIPAVVLDGAGILVNVPRPERYALHKLIVSQRRQEGAAKIDKDLLQAEALLDVLVDRRLGDLKRVWRDLVRRGPKWRAMLQDGLTAIDAKVRERLQAAGLTEM